jgi:hypothetical protein
VPREKLSLVAATTEVIAKKSLDSSIGYRIMQALTDTHNHGDSLARPGEFPSEDHATLPLSSFAHEYYRTGVPWDFRTLPLPLAVLFRYYIAVILPLAVIGPLWDVIGWPKPIAIAPNVLLRKGRRRLHAYLLRRAEGELARGDLVAGKPHRSLDRALGMIERSYARQSGTDQVAASARRLREKLAEIDAEAAIVDSSAATEPALRRVGGGHGRSQVGQTS